MKPTVTIIAIALLAIGVGSPAMASDDTRPQAAQQKEPVNSSEPGLQGIFNPAAPGQPGQGWRYYRDPASYRAVVISPQGDYYFSDGEHLRWVAQAQPLPS